MGLSSERPLVNSLFQITVRMLCVPGMPLAGTLALISPGGVAYAPTKLRAPWLSSEHHRWLPRSSGAFVADGGAHSKTARAKQFGGRRAILMSELLRPRMHRPASASDTGCGWTMRSRDCGWPFCCRSSLTPWSRGKRCWRDSTGSSSWPPIPCRLSWPPREQSAAYNASATRVP